MELLHLWVSFMTVLFRGMNCQSAADLFVGMRTILGGRNELACQSMLTWFASFAVKSFSPQRSRRKAAKIAKKSGSFSLLRLQSRLLCLASLHKN